MPAKTPTLRWSHQYPDGAEFDWGPDAIGGGWLYASRAGIHIAMFFRGPGEVSEIDVRPLELGLYACEVRCRSLADCKRKAVQLVQGALLRLAKKWGAK